MVREILNEHNEIIYRSEDYDECYTVLCKLLWNKYVINTKAITRVSRHIINDEEGMIKFYFDNGIKEKFSDIPLKYGHLQSIYQSD